MTRPPVNAPLILRLLSERHARDIAVAECPLEPYGALRADLWVMRPSWTKPMVTIYEVKVSRQDFLRDDKWRNYLPYCNAFWFAVAPGVVDPREIQEGVGLLELSKTGTMMRTLVKPHLRDDDHQALAQVTKAVLMNRVWTRGGMRIATDCGKTRDQRIAEWRETAEAAESCARLMSRRVRDELSEARAARRRAEDSVEAYAEFQEILRRNGITPTSSSWQMERQLEQQLGGELEASLRSASIVLDRALLALTRKDVVPS